MREVVERITEQDRKNRIERDKLVKRLFDCRIGSEAWIKAKAALNAFDELIASQNI